MLEQESISSPELNPLIINPGVVPTEADPASLEISVLKKIFGPDFDETDERVKTFTSRLCHELEPDQTTEEVVARVVATAVEVEFGPAGVKTLGLDRFIKLMTEAICLNEEMLERTIALASRCLKVKLNISNQPVQ